MATRLSHFHTKPSHLTRSPIRPTTRNGLPHIVAMAHDSYWATIESEIETYLKQAIPIRKPESVFEPKNHLTFAAPRTTAPSLAIAACELVGGERGEAMAAAAAVHLMHAAAYAHENLPLTDRPRPHHRPSIEHKFGPNIELLTGDGIIPYGLELLARSMDMSQMDSDKILRVIIELSRSMGSQGIVDGQFHELSLDEHDYDRLEYVTKKKEGELHACGAACGAILGGGAEEEIERLRNFGMYFGMVKGMSGREYKLGLKDNVDKLKELALKELESFQGKNIEMVVRLVELDPILAVA